MKPINRFRHYLSGCLLLILFFSQQATAQQPFDQFFEKKSLRIDFALSGNAETQSAALQQLREEPVWSGPVKNLTDRFGYGGYYVHIYDKATNRLIYSKGFNTLFEEWRTTAQAAVETQSRTNSLSIPYPKRPVVFELTARNRDDNQFDPLLKIEIDPASIFIDRSPLKKRHVNQIRRQGEPSGKVDLVFLPEGYTDAEMTKFAADVERFTQSLFEIPPFDQYRNDFNVWSVELPSEDSGVDIAGEGIFKNTALNAGFYTFGIDRYLTTPDMKAIRDAVWDVPCDAVFILVNDERYGGGGMYNFYAIGSADNKRTADVFIHEFGHSFGGLGDEYFQSEVAYGDFYNLSAEPWEPNITTLVHFDAKWKKMLSAGTPVPTPLEAPYADKLGVFEGGGYLSKGIYRPMDHCMMRDYAPFCPVCSQTIRQMIDYYADR